MRKLLVTTYVANTRIRWKIKWNGKALANPFEWAYKPVYAVLALVVHSCPLLIPEEAIQNSPGN